jgi:hypothetical protein
VHVPADELHQVDALELVAGALDASEAEAQLQAALIRAWLAGYWQAIEEARSILEGSRARRRRSPARGAATASEDPQRQQRP